jgi:hypothetical protein
MSNSVYVYECNKNRHLSFPPAQLSPPHKSRVLICHLPWHFISFFRFQDEKCCRPESWFIQQFGQDLRRTLHRHFWSGCSSACGVHSCACPQARCRRLKCQCVSTPTGATSTCICICLCVTVHSCACSKARGRRLK